MFTLLPSVYRELSRVKTVLRRTPASGTYPEAPTPRPRHWVCTLFAYLTVQPPLAVLIERLLHLHAARPLAEGVEQLPVLGRPLSLFGDCCVALPA